MAQLWEQEKPLFLPLPTRDFAACTTHLVLPNAYSQVEFDTNRYSVSVERRNAQLVLEAYPFSIRILAVEGVVVEHPRCFGREQDIVEPLHSLPLLEQRPGEFEHAVPIRRWRTSWPQAYEQLLALLRRRWPECRGVREFIAILKLHSEYPGAWIDEILLRQPVGVCAIIAPFNFPGMIPFWFLPYALACGNPVIIKPSERVPLPMQRIVQLFDALDLPPGVLNLVNNGREAVDALLDAPEVRAVSFVGSTSEALAIYARAAQNGKRAQCQGGAKNPVVILPDADMEMTTRIVADSAFGCAGQRCLAASTAITVGEAGETFIQSIAEAAVQRVTGYGLDAGVQMGPVISPASLERIEGLVSQAVADGA